MRIFKYSPKDLQIFPTHKIIRPTVGFLTKEDRHEGLADKV